MGSDNTFLFLLQAITVQWTDAPIASFIHNFKCAKPMAIEYTVEMVPNLMAEAPLKSHLFHKLSHKLKMKKAWQLSGGDLLQEKKNLLLTQEDTYQGDFDYTETFYCPYLGATADVKPAASGKSGGGDKKEEAKQEVDGGGGGGGGDKKCKLPPEIKIIISTEINGRTIAQKTEKVPLLPRIVEIENHQQSTSNINTL